MTTGLGGRLARFSMRRRRAVLLGSAALTLLSLLSFRTLRLDIDLLDTLPSGRPAFDDFTEYLRTFGGTQTLIVLVDKPTASVPAARDAEETAHDVRVLNRAVDLLVERYQLLPEIRSVMAGVDPAALQAYLDPANAPALVPAAHFPELVARLEPDGIATALARLKGMLAMPVGSDLLEQARRDPLFLGGIAGSAIREQYADPFAGRTETRLLSPDLDAALIILSPTGSPFDAPFTKKLFAGLHQAEADARSADPELFTGLRLRHGGAHEHAVEDAKLVEGDVARYVLLTLIAVIAIFQLFYRSPIMLPLIGYLLVAGSLLAFAASVLFYHQLNALSLSFAAIFYGLAIDSGIHFYSRLLIERRTAPLEEAIVRTCDGIFGANLVAEGTTAAAFGVIALSAIAAVHEIGVLSAAGMLINIVHTFILLPAMTATVADRIDRRTPPRQDADWLAAIAGWSARHAYTITIVSVVAALGWMLRSPAVPVDAEITHLRPAGVESTETEEAVDARFGALVPRGVAVVRGPDLEAALAREERVVAWLQAHRAPSTQDAGAGSATTAAGAAVAPRDQLVTGYQALSAFLPSHAAETARRAAFAALPLDRVRTTLDTELHRQGFHVAAFDDALHAFDAVATAQLPRPADDVALGGAADGWLAPFLRRHVGRGVMRAVGGGSTSTAAANSDGAPAVLIAIPFQPAEGVTLDGIRDRVRTDVDPGVVVTGLTLMQEALGTVIAREVILFTVLTIVLNIIIVVPQTRSWPLALAVMAPTIVVVGVLLTGMHLTGVAFTPLNLVVLPLTLGIGVDNCVYLVARLREGRSIEDATRLTGRAIAVTTLTTTAGFGFLGISRYPGLAGLGCLAAVAIALTFVAAIVLQPAFLVLERRTLADATERAGAEGRAA